MLYCTLSRVDGFCFTLFNGIVPQGLVTQLFFLSFFKAGSSYIDNACTFSFCTNYHTACWNCGICSSRSSPSIPHCLFFFHSHSKKSKIFELLLWKQTCSCPFLSSWRGMLCISQKLIPAVQLLLCCRFHCDSVKHAHGIFYRWALL